jgi:hypothetical protein
MTPLHEYNKNKRAQSGKNVLVALGIGVVIAGASFYYYRTVMHRGNGEGMDGGRFGADQMFRNGDAGYSLSIPSDWHIAQEGSSSVAVYPAASSCKITISSFPSVGESERATWIGGRLGADASVNVAERSSGQVSVDGTPAIRWDGTMDGIPVTFVYAFTSQHAYEIAPSIVNGSGDNNSDGADDVASCEDVLSELMGDIHFSAESQDAFSGDAMDNVAVAATTPEPSREAEPTISVATATTTSAATSTGSVLGASIVATSSEVATDTDDEVDCL